MECHPWHKVDWYGKVSITALEWRPNTADSVRPFVMLGSEPVFPRRGRNTATEQCRTRPELELQQVSDVPNAAITSQNKDLGNSTAK